MSFLIKGNLILLLFYIVVSHSSLFFRRTFKEQVLFLRRTFLISLLSLASLEFLWSFKSFLTNYFFKNIKTWPLLPVDVLPRSPSSPASMLESSLSLPNLWGSLLFVYLLGTFFFFLYQLVNYFRIVFKSRRQSFLVKKLHNVEIRHNPNIISPFVVLFFRKSMIFVNCEDLQSQKEWKLILKHELQHLRNGDLHWMLFYRMIGFLFFYNPVYYLLEKKMELIEEFSCDESVLSGQRHSKQEYMSLLCRLAQLQNNSGRSRNLKVPIRSIANFSPPSHLRRRLMNITRINLNNKKQGPIASLAMYIFLGVFIPGILHSAPTLWTLTELKQFIKNEGNLGTSEGFPLSINESVLNKVQDFLNNKAKRKWFKESLSRMEKASSIVDPVVKQYNMPDEIKVLALIESGYQNLPANKNTAAGVWQFIESTARIFGLKVDQEKDERFDIKKQTDAAMRYLSSEKLRYQDWELAIMAYNMGGNNLNKGIQKTGSRNAWDLIRSGYEGDKGYLEKFMAALLLYKNQKLLEE